MTKPEAIQERETVGRRGSSWPEDVLRQIRGTLFHPATGLVYDYVTSREPDARFRHLPSPEEVARSFPNPCGWGTGMEDCAINTALTLCLLALRGEADSPFARALFAGLVRCGAVHGTPGFIARGILPEDGRSCYPDTSRDQVTIATCGMWSFLRSPGAPPDLRRPGTEFLCAAADYCERTVRPENGYDYCRLDGRPGAVSRMWNCCPHEMMRLPMIYGIAAHLSGDRRYFDLMAGCAPEGLRRTLAMDPDSPEWWDMPLLQMQMSLAFFAESRILPGLLPGVRRAMELAAGIAERRLADLLDQAESHSGPWTELFENWRMLDFTLRKDTLAPDGRSALFGGLPYANPIFRQSYACPNRLLRGIGNYLATMAQIPDFPIPADPIRRTDRLMRGIDAARLPAAGTVPLLYGFTKTTGLSTRRSTDHERKSRIA